MNALLILFFSAVFLFPPFQQPFTRFIYCRDSSSGIFEQQCVDLKADGSGQSRMKRRGFAEIVTPVTLSASAQEKFLSVIAATRNLEDGQKYESRKKVANLGRKHLTLEMPSGTREAEFNYSDLKEVNALSTFFDALLNQQALVSDMETAAQYERLSIPERLDQLESELKVGRIGDPQGLIPTLDKIIQNDRILEYAREHAKQLKERILAAK